MMRVREVMAGEDEFVLGTNDLVDAARQMRDLGTGSLLVRDGDGHLQGLLTSLDVVGCVAGGIDPATARVEEYAGECELTAQAEDPLADVVCTMTQHGLERIPVLDGQRLVGVLRFDAARRAVRLHDASDDAPDGDAGSDAAGLSAQDGARPA